MPKQSKFERLERLPSGKCAQQIPSAVPVKNGQPAIINNYPPLEVEGEVVTNDTEMPSTAVAASGTEEIPWSQLMKGEPYFPEKPDEKFPSSTPAKKTLPFQQVGLHSGECAGVNTIHEGDRIKTFARIMAQVILRIQKEKDREHSNTE